MNRKDVPAIKSTLPDVRKRFEDWRSTKRRRDPIPEELWLSAVELIPEYSIQQISKELHLSHADLKWRVEEAQRDMPSEAISVPGFVEVDINRPVLPLECVFEMEGGSGIKTKLSVKGVNGLDLMGLAKVFWERGTS